MGQTALAAGFPSLWGPHQGVRGPESKQVPATKEILSLQRRN